jgi:hypothetical protein
MDYAEALTLLNASTKNYLKAMLKQDLESAQTEASNILWISTKLYESTKVIKDERRK